VGSTALHLLLLSAVALGFARLARALPGVHRAQTWLEGTWTHGKPLTCWTCLTGWGAFLGVLLRPPGGLPDAILLWLGATGLAATLLRRWDPILPAMVTLEPPPLPEEDE